MKPSVFLAFLLCLTATPALATSGVMFRDEALRASASATSASVARVSKGDVVEVLGRQGGWTQVARGSQRGWVRILSVRVEAAGGAGAALGGLVEAGTRRTDPSRVVAVAGLRGLSEEELRSARFDANQLLNLERNQVDRAAAEHYARAVGLRHRDLDYLPAPQREKAPARGRDGLWGDGGSL